MAPKIEKEWQMPLDSTEKRITDTIEKRIVDSSQELSSKMMENINKINEKLVDDIKSLVIAELKDMKKDIGEMKEELKETGIKMQEVDEKIKGLEDQIKKFKSEKETADLRYEIKLRDLQLRVRGIEEERNENIREKILSVLSELIEKPTEDLDKEIDQIYRLKSRTAEQRGLPNDVIVNVLTRRLKEQILKQYLDNPIEFNGKKVRILRELPRQILTDRKTYWKLTEKLTKKNIRFRWELPTGLSFEYKEEKKWIKTEEQLNKFLQETMEDWED